MTFRAPLVWRPPVVWRQQHETNNPNLLVSTLAPTGAAPFRQQDWPNPQYRFIAQPTAQPNSLPFIQSPFFQADWPNPAFRYARDSGFTGAGIVSTPAAAPFVNPDFGMPAWSRGQQDTVFPNLLLTTLAPVGAAPFFQTQWDNPPVTFRAQDTMSLNVTITLPPGPSPVTRRPGGVDRRRLLLEAIRRDDEEIMTLAGLALAAMGNEHGRD